MLTASPRVSLSRLKIVPYVCAALAILAGATNILGWIWDSPFLKDPFGTNFMAPNTALCLIVVGLALAVQQQDISRWFWKLPNVLFSAFVALFGLLTTFEYATGIDLRIDRLFLPSDINDWTAPNILPGRFAPNTAVSFAFLGLALLLPNVHLGKFRLSELFTLPVMFITFLGIVGYAYHAEPLYGIAHYSAMALHTAIALMICGIGLLWSRSNFGIMSLVLSADAGGVAARRLLLATLIALPILGWMRLQAQNKNLLEPKFGTALFVIASVAIFCFMIIQTAYILRELDGKRREAEESLLQSHAELETQVALRTLALRQLSARLIQMQDDERRKIARELHDGLGQYLAALAINLDRLGDDSQDHHGLLLESRQLLERTVGEMRTLSHLLHPPLLDEIGFASAATWYVEGFAKRSGVTVNLDIPGDLPRLHHSVEIGLFRILQEALVNIHRHSGSSRADIRLEVSGSQLSLHIRDYGKGIPPAVLQKWRASGAAGVGLSGMRERVSELGGKMEISSAIQGTLIVVTVPFRVAAETAPPMQRRAGDQVSEEIPAQPRSA